MEKIKLTIPKEVFKQTKYLNIADCAIARTLREKLHPQPFMEATVGSITGDAFEVDKYGFRLRCIASYTIGQQADSIVRQAYKQPRTVEITITKLDEPR